MARDPASHEEIAIRQPHYAGAAAVGRIEEMAGMLRGH